MVISYRTADGEAAADYPWKAAVATADITPKENLWMAGYAARKGPSEKVLQPIHAKVLAIEDAEGGRFVFVTMDLIGVPKPFREAVESLAQEKYQIELGSLLINASHTHSGPMIRLYQPPKGGPEQASYISVPDDQQELRVRQTKEYNAGLLASVDRMIGEVLANLAPATVSWSHSRCSIAMNRRTPGKPGEWKNAPNSEGPVDHEVPVLQVRAKEDGSLKAVMFGYACHATVLSLMEFSGDWPGYAQRYFEEDHPGTVAMFLNGCSGDQNPYPRRLLHYAERHGRSMATSIEAALETQSTPIVGPIRAAIAWPEIPYQTPPSREELVAKSKSSDTYDAHHGQMLLDVLDATGTLPKSYPVPVQVVKFGDSLTVAAIGGEVVVDYSLRLKRELGELTGGAPVWVAGYSNDVMTYIPSKRVLEEGGYEGGGAMRYIRSSVHPAPWDPSIEERLVGKIMELAKALH
ncbi:MAG: neutral/alkaline non-lysosomal ceramidase N-terminal domain-containing protein [Verrucomicrobiae bacterium]|nr:neutral/alkaline non-lysosomal ceramidase N-terminal domain-containing protein [Verrucomicrobiae bacterium]